MTIVVESVHCRHMAETADIDVTAGMTVRGVLAALRGMERISFGDLGSCVICLSDGTNIEVANCPASDGGTLLASQVIARTSYDAYSGRDIVVRRYTW